MSSALIGDEGSEEERQLRYLDELRQEFNRVVQAEAQEAGELKAAMAAHSATSVDVPAVPQGVHDTAVAMLASARTLVDAPVAGDPQKQAEFESALAQQALKFKSAMTDSHAGPIQGVLEAAAEGLIPDERVEALRDARGSVSQWAKPAAELVKKLQAHARESAERHRLADVAAKERAQQAKAWAAFLDRQRQRRAATEAAVDRVSGTANRVLSQLQKHKATPRDLSVPEGAAPPALRVGDRLSSGGRCAAAVGVGGRLTHAPCDPHDASQQWTLSVRPTGQLALRNADSGRYLTSAGVSGVSPDEAAPLRWHDDGSLRNGALEGMRFGPDGVISWDSSGGERFLASCGDPAASGELTHAFRAGDWGTNRVTVGAGLAPAADGLMDLPAGMVERGAVVIVAGEGQVTVRSREARLGWGSDGTARVFPGGPPGVPNDGRLHAAAYGWVREGRALRLAAFWDGEEVPVAPRRGFCLRDCIPKWRIDPSDVTGVMGLVNASPVDVLAAMRALTVPRRSPV